MIYLHSRHYTTDVIFIGNIKVILLFNGYAVKYQYDFSNVSEIYNDQYYHKIVITHVGISGSILSLDMF